MINPSHLSLRLFAMEALRLLYNEEKVWNRTLRPAVSPDPVPASGEEAWVEVDIAPCHLARSLDEFSDLLLQPAIHNLYHLARNRGIDCRGQMELVYKEGADSCRVIGDPDTGLTLRLAACYNFAIGGQTMIITVKASPV